VNQDPRYSREYLAQIARAKRDQQDAAILYAHADRLNKEALDVLDYQDLS